MRTKNNPEKSDNKTDKKKMKGNYCSLIGPSSMTCFMTDRQTDHILLTVGEIRFLSCTPFNWL